MTETTGPEPTTAESIDPTAACGRCGFRADDYSDRDLRTSPRWLASMAGSMWAPSTNPAAGPASVPVLATAHRELHETIERVARSLAADDGAPGHDPGHDHADGRADGRAGAGASAGGVDVAAVHEALHRLSGLGRLLHEHGFGVTSAVGSVAQVSVSAGGVPKAAITSGEVGPRGFVSDTQANRVHHGRPFQAVCLWSSEVIEALVAEGHPIHAGAAGENVTVSGIDWASLRSGVRLLVGDVLLEVSGWAEPCRKNDQWFLERSDRIDHAVHPGWSRAYAWVREGGTISVGDEVVVEP